MTTVRRFVCGRRGGDLLRCGGRHVRVDFLNCSDDPKLDPVVVHRQLSNDGTRLPPSFCLPWVEASRHVILLKSNFEYRVRKSGSSIAAYVDRGDRAVRTVSVRARSGDRQAFVSETPYFSSPWQQRMRHSVTLKLGICWWTPPGWGLLFMSPPGADGRFSVVDGFVRTDLWHCDVPIVVHPSTRSLRLPKYSIVAAAIPVYGDHLDLGAVADRPAKLATVRSQMLMKAHDHGVYKQLLPCPRAGVRTALRD